MHNEICATPYNTEYPWFYFTSWAEYEKKAEQNGAEEFTLEYISGDEGELFRACKIDQSNLELWFDDIESMSDEEKLCLFYLMDHSLSVNLAEAIKSAKSGNFNFFEGRALEAATDEFDSHLMDRIPEDLRIYIDYEAFKIDLKANGDLREFTYQGKTWCCVNANQ